MTVLAVLAALALQDTDVERAAQKLAQRFTDEPESVEGLFHPDFFEGASAERVTLIFKNVHGQYGECTAVELVADESASAGVVYFVFGDRTRLAATIVVEREKPHRVTGLRFDMPRPVRRTVDEVLDEMKKLRGKTAFLLQRTGERPLTVAEHQPDRPLAVGSTFKLAVLGALLADPAAKEKRYWARAVELSDDRKSMGSGVLDTWTPGSPLTLHTLATLMISQSDNTATDHLIHALGRERVEGIAAEMGLADEKRNLPLLTTLEAFKLKASDALRKKFAAGDAEERRKLLAGPVRELPREGLSFGSGPLAIDEVEWFASASDCCRAMEWLRKRTDDPALAAGREILSVNPGVRFLKRAWKYVGFKGGSEPGVVSVSCLLRSSAGDWYTLSATWNDPKRPLDEGLFMDLVQDAVYALQRK